MKNAIVLTLLFAAALTAAPAMACQYDTDCSYGSTCLKSDYSLYGVCAGGLNPGNSNDSKPVYNTYNRQDSSGRTCSYDTDCSYGQSCRKSTYSYRGVCQ